MSFKKFSAFFATCQVLKDLSLDLPWMRGVKSRRCPLAPFCYLKHHCPVRSLGVLVFPSAGVVTVHHRSFSLAALHFTIFQEVFRTFGLLQRRTWIPPSLDFLKKWLTLENSCRCQKHGPYRFSGEFCLYQSHLYQLQEMWVQSLGWEDPLEEGMATHSSIHAWKIP